MLYNDIKRLVLGLFIFSTISFFSHTTEGALGRHQHKGTNSSFEIKLVLSLSNSSVKFRSEVFLSWEKFSSVTRGK